MRADSTRRTTGFSLVEMLLAIFILGIGVISISALFPAGIALQRQANDDVLGPIVAKNALATIRSKLSQDDFGSFQDFLGPFANVDYLAPGIAGTFRTSGGTVVPHVKGDWCWMRPGFLFDPNNNGTIDVFSAAYTRQQYGLQPFPPTAFKATEITGGVQFSTDGFLYGLPYNPGKYPLFTLAPSNAAQLDVVSQRMIEPAVTFTQAERSYPQGAANYAGSTPSQNAPQYHWDCMFRRNGGRVQVAVFVYRVTPPGGEARGYTVGRIDNALLGTAPAGTIDATQQTPPIPMVYYAPNPGTATSWPNRAGTLPDEIPGTGPGSAFGAGKTWDDWMAPGQVWIDNHANVHEVLRGRLVAGATGSAQPNQGPVKLQRPIPIMPRSPVNGVAPTVSVNNGPQSFNGYIGAIWFVPNTDRFGNVITPIYATVEEL